MRCPKCHYITFDNGERCRNCGYEFAFAAEADAPEVDLPIQTGDEPIGPMRDFSLGDLDTAFPSQAPDGTPLPGRSPAQPRPAAAAPTPAAAESNRPITSTLDLPLFGDGRGDDDRPLVTPPAVPRAPLSVRRSSPALPRGQARATEEPELDLEPPDPEDHAGPPVRRASGLAPHRAAAGMSTDGAAAVAGAGQRLMAALIDALLLAVINAAVLYFTLRLVGLTFAEVRGLPPVPLVAFLMLLTGGYFVSFTTAGGQTIGKMAAGIRVVPAAWHDGATDRVPLGHAVVRAAALLVSLASAGLGYLPALFGQERRAIHDRLADTRVVKA